MHGDLVSQAIIRLRQRGYRPRQIGRRVWDARCPVCASKDRALLLRAPSQITCRSAKGCAEQQVLAALDLEPEHAFAPAQTAAPPDAETVPDRESARSSDRVHSKSPDDDQSHRVDPGSPRMTLIPFRPNGTRPVRKQSVARAPVGAAIAPGHGSAQTAVGLPCATIVGTADATGLLEQHAAIEKRPAYEVLMGLARSMRTIRADDGRHYAAVGDDGRLDYFRLESDEFRRLLIGRYHTATGQLPQPSVLANVLATLRGRAEMERDVEAVFLRVARDPATDAFLLDLGDVSQGAVEIQADGWSLVDRHGVHFRRPPGQRALPTPALGGSIDLLKKYVNVAASQWPLLVVWLTTAVRPVGPYPPLVLTGESGSAKTTLARVCRRLVDPHATLLRSLPKSERELMVAVHNNWLLAFDNVRTLSTWQSDALCRLSTGGGIGARGFSSDDRELIIEAQRPVIVNGIDDFVRRSELMDRCIFLRLPPILDDDRRGDETFWTEFDQDYAPLLGALLDAVAGGIRLWPEIELPMLTRMADIDRWGEAVARGLAWDPGSFIDAYRANRRMACARAIEDNPVVMALVRLIRCAGRLRCTATELLRRLNQLKPLITVATKDWPNSADDLALALRRLAPQLRELGLHVTLTRTGAARTVTIERE